MTIKPITIGTVEVKNRIVMAPVATYLSADDGKVTEEILTHYGARASGGGIGIIVTEHSYIDLRGKAKAKQMSISNDEDVEGLSRLADMIKRNGTKAVAQLNHAGSAAPSAVTGERAVSSSSVVLPVSPGMGDEEAPVAMTLEQIGKVVQDFADAAKRAKLAGFDGVEIHSAHAYLLNQFYSPLTNKRTDEYGGSLDNRLRIHREVIRAVRETIGADYLISIRHGGCDYTEGGSTIEDSVFAAKEFEKAGVDMISVTGGMCRYVRKGHDEPGYFGDMSMAIRENVSVPVMLTGGVKRMQDAEALLREGKADLIGIGRELLKNPSWAEENK